jgi:hypothetical protein
MRCHPSSELDDRCSASVALPLVCPDSLALDKRPVRREFGDELELAPVDLEHDGNHAVVIDLGFRQLADKHGNTHKAILPETANAAPNATESQGAKRSVSGGIVPKAAHTFPRLLLAPIRDLGKDDLSERFGDFDASDIGRAVRSGDVAKAVIGDVEAGHVSDENLHTPAPDNPVRGIAGTPKSEKLRSFTHPQRCAA